MGNWGTALLVWIFVRRKPAGVPEHRGQALAIVLVTSTVAAWWKLSLQGRSAYEGPASSAA
jgi:hypothetical protein